MTIYGGLHPKFDVARLYIPRKDGGTNLLATGGCMELVVRGLEVHAYGNKERLIQAAW